MRPQNYMAQDDYIVVQATYFSDHDQDVVVNLYQPLIGPVALALYLSLWQTSHAKPLRSDRKKQTALMDLLGVDLDTLYDARIHLEAMGLMKTYTAVDQNGRYWAYELYRPVAANAFFQDDTLSLLLYDRVGQTRYDTLVQRYTIHTVKAAAWQDVSAQLLDVFQLTSVALPAPVVASQQAVAQKPLPEVTLSDGAGYDWTLLDQLLSRSDLAAGQVAKNRSALAQLATFYGLTPPVLARHIMQATSPVSGQLAMPRLKQIIEQTYAKQRPHLTAKTGATPAATPKADGSIKLTAQQQTLLQQAKSTPPREFLEQAKHAKNPNLFVASSETRAVSQLASRQVFDNATVNILVSYILQNYDSVTQALIDNIANRWLGENVTSPEAALKAIDDYQAKQHKPKPRNGRPSRQEATPDWMKKDYQPTKETVSAATKQELAAQLAELEALRKEQSHGTNE